MCPVVVRLGEMLHQWRAQLLLEKRSCASPWGRSRQGPRSGDSRPSTKVGSFLVGFFFLVGGGGCCYSAVVLIALVLLLAEGIGLGLAMECCCKAAVVLVALVLLLAEASARLAMGSCGRGAVVLLALVHSLVEASAWRRFRLRMQW